MILLALIAAVGGLIAFLWTWRPRIHEITLRLHQAQIVLDGENRLATFGKVASLFAHEVGNPLASIMTRLELMVPSDEERFLRDSLPIVLFSTRLPTGAAAIDVSDDGPGVPDGIRDRIFDPFVPTDPGGTGSCLTVSRCLVRRRGSELDLVSRDGHGACFQIQLPRAESNLDTAA